MNIANLFRKDIRKIKAYTPSPTVRGVSRETGIPMKKIVKLDTGENYRAPVKPIGETLKRLNSVSSYPDPFASNLTKELSIYCNVSEDMIVCGNGSDELIDLVCRLFINSGDECIIPEPTFSMYRFYTRLNGGKPVPVLRNNDLSLNTNKILNSLTTQTKIIWIASPNNPAGLWTPLKEIKKLLETKKIVVVDEAYYEFCNKTVIKLLPNYSNLIILRSFSKWAGLAGLRIGYMVADKLIIDKIKAIKPPYNTNIAAQKAAVAVLKNFNLYIASVKKLINERDRLINACYQLPRVTVYPSDSIYFVVKLQNKSASKLKNYLQSKGILVKVIDTPYLPNSIRVTPGKNKAEGDRLLKELNNYLSLGKPTKRNPKYKTNLLYQKSNSQTGFLFDYHVQTIEHGANKPLRIKETIKAAIEHGLSAICLTDHYPLPRRFVDPTPKKDCAMPLSKYNWYRNKLSVLQKKYSKRLDVFIGAEFDWLPRYRQWTKKQLRKWPFDYVIGSVHFLDKIADEKGERIFLIDYTKDEFYRGIAYYGGIKKLIKRYYLLLEMMISADLFDAVGHFDLVKKFNNGQIFDEKEDWYQNTVKKVIDTLAKSNMALEINTAGLQRACQATYPSLWILKRANKRKIPVTIGSDAHRPSEVGNNLDFAVKLARKAGYRSIIKFINRQKIKVPI